MSKVLDAVKTYVDTLDFNIIRLSEMSGEDNIETLEYLPSNPCQDCYSIAKAFTMTAIGILYDKGLIKPEDKVCDIMKDEIPEGMDDRWYKVTVDNTLTHWLGLPTGFLDIDCNPSKDFTDDFLKYMFSYPLPYELGTAEHYSDGAYYLLSRIVEKIDGRRLDKFLWEEILWKMGYQEMAFSCCPQGHSMGATGLYIHSSDGVKLGWLYLNKGMYNGERLLSEEWCEMALERLYTFEWDETHKVFFKGGMCGQKLFVIPEKRKAYCLQSYGANSNTIMNFVRDIETEG